MARRSRAANGELIKENVSQSAPTTFRLELDLVLSIVPPMSETADGIRLTRVIDLPFPPTPSVHLTGIALHGQAVSMGCPLKNLTWDIDRRVFIADTYLQINDHPLPWVVDELCQWIDQGWRLGSYEENYPEMQDDDSISTELEQVAEDSDDDEIADAMPTRPPRSRTPEFNKLLQALAREMATLRNHESIAYAIAKTKYFFTDDQLKERDTKSKEKFAAAVAEFEQMSMDAQIDWRDHAIRTLPRLDRIVKSAQAIENKSGHSE